MNAYIVPFASAIGFFLGCALLRALKNYADLMHLLLTWAAILLMTAVLIVASIRAELTRQDSHAPISLEDAL